METIYNYMNYKEGSPQYFTAYINDGVLHRVFKILITIKIETIEDKDKIKCLVEHINKYYNDHGIVLNIEQCYSVANNFLRRL